MLRSAIMRDNTAGLAIVKPEVLSPDKDALGSERERSITEGRAAGYADGLAEARDHARLAATQARAAHESALEALLHAASDALQVLATERERLEHHAIDLAFGIAKAVLAREISTSSSPGLDAVKRAIAESPTKDELVVRLNPADAENISDVTRLDGVVKVVVDPTISRGGCVLEVGAALVDAQIDTALVRVAKVLNEATGRQ